MTTRNAFPSNFALAVTAPTKEEVMGRDIGLSLSLLPSIQVSFFGAPRREEVVSSVRLFVVRPLGNDKK